MVILLSPTKTFNKVNNYSSNEPLFTKNTNKLVNKFKEFDESDFKNKFKISKNLSKTTFKYYQNFKNELSAIHTYGGTAFKHLDVATIPDEKVEKIYILSALYGILKHDDAISKYRFEMQSNIFGSLYDYWNKPINNYLFSNYKNNLIINLASNEYSKVLDFDKLNIITISFANIDNDSLKSPSMMVKKQRGLMARAILLNKVSNVEQLKALIVDGYQFNLNHSSKNNYMFTKGA